MIISPGCDAIPCYPLQKFVLAMSSFERACLIRREYIRAKSSTLPLPCPQKPLLSQEFWLLGVHHRGVIRVDPGILVPTQSGHSQRFHYCCCAVHRRRFHGVFDGLIMSLSGRFLALLQRHFDGIWRIFLWALVMAGFGIAPGMLTVAAQLPSSSR